MKRHKHNKTLAFLLALVIASAVVCTAFATFEVGKSHLTQAKVTNALTQKLQATSDRDVTAVVWLRDIDISEIENIALNALGEAQENGDPANLSRNALSSMDTDKIQSYIRTKRELSKNSYVAHNTQIIDGILGSADILYVSKCAPMVVLKLGATAVEKLQDSSYVEVIDLFDEILVSTNSTHSSTDSTRATTTEEISLSNVKKITRAYTVNTSSAYGYTGTGVKIGMIEEYVPAETSWLTAYHGDISPAGSHASNTLEVMRSVAPNATYYAVGVGNYTIPTETSTHAILAGVEWLIADCGVNIINSSYTFSFHNEGSSELCYGVASMWVDHLSYQHNVHFVAAAGNSGEDGVAKSAMAYNAIAVGNLYVKGTTEYGDDELWSGNYSSSYNWSELSYANKPDICAPGEGIRMLNGSIFNGTSAASPQVAAAIALMCEQRPALLTQQKTVKAILAASVNFDTDIRYVPGTDDYKMYGAGLLDCVGACWVVGNYRYTTGSMPANGSDQTHTFTVTSSDSRIRVALSWNIKSLSSVDGHGTITSADTALPDLNLKVLDPNDNLVKVSMTTNNNVEIVDFVPTMTGTYKIVVMCGSNVARTVPYSLAWR